MAHKEDTVEDLLQTAGGKQPLIVIVGPTAVGKTSLSIALAKRLDGKNITVNAVHPGVVGTDVFREYPKWFAKFMNLMISKPIEGAKPSIYLASSEELDNVTGKYFYKTKQKDTDNIANDLELSEKIWIKTEELTGINYVE